MAAARAAWCLVAIQALMVDHAAASQSGSSAVHLQQDGVARADSGLTWRHTLPSLTTYTFCVKLFSFRRRYVDYMFSYATEGYDNELAFHLKYSEGELRMACCSRRVFHIEQMEARLLSWFSFCVAVDLSTYAASFVFGNTVKNVTLFDSLQNSSRPLEVVGGGTVIVGQDQDEQLGGTDKDQSFNGFIVDMLLTQSLLTVRDMTDYVSCNMDRLRTFTYILDFKNITEDFILGAETVVAEVGDVCRPGRDKRLSVFPEARTNAEANHFCSTLNGYIVTPLSDEENMSLFNEGSQFRDKCTEFDKKNAMWVGVFWDPSARLWKNQITSEEAKFKNFEVEIMPSSNERLCVSAATVSESASTTLQGVWDIESCQREVCTACQFERSLPLKIRGLCAESHFDRSYYIYGTLSFRPVFNGARLSRIEWRDNSTWVLYQMDNPFIRAHMLDSTDTGYPVGVHDYEVIGDKCPGKVQRLKLTSCRGNTFTCGDGECIDISRRCNLELDCDDHSDELNCDTLIIQPGYEKRLPPPKIDSNTPAGVAIDCDILLIRKLDLLSAQLILDVAIKRTWYDSRIHFKNLHSDHNLNQISDPMEIVWYPDLTVVGSDNSHVMSTFYVTKAWGQRSSKPLPDDDTLIDEDVFFPGSSNPLVLHREFTTTLMCTFDLTLYPFDTQSCPMLLYVADYTFQYVSTSLQNVTFSGTRRLLEYRVTSVIHRSFLHENKSGQHIEIVITNLYGYYISGAYVPTMLLVIISYLTFFFDLSDFTNRIMVSLTSLLVLASLFSQIASGLPKTAYMKLIDVWFIFCILADFVMVFVLVVINSCMLKKEEPSPPSFHRVRPFSVTASTSLASYPSGLKPRSRLFHKLPFKEKGTGWQVLDPRRCNTMAQVSLPILLSLFVLIYFGSVAYYMERVEAEFGV
ncbi:uncharacterized protein LOC135108154 isoform X2 [Scylla paramamosain]